MTVLAVTLLLAAGCDRPEKQVPIPMTPPGRAVRVVVPDAVKARWKAVKIAVQDRDTNQETVYAIDIGSDFSIPGSKLHLAVLAFLPAFLMDGKSLTSISNETTNPAAQIVISEDSQVLFKGWLFGLYPTTHSFQHPRFSFALVGSVPTRPKG